MTRFVHMQKDHMKYLCHWCRITLSPSETDEWQRVLGTILEMVPLCHSNEMQPNNLCFDVFCGL
jgi:hypothetical protein